MNNYYNRKGEPITYTRDWAKLFEDREKLLRTWMFHKNKLADLLEVEPLLVLLSSGEDRVFVSIHPPSKQP